MYKVWFKTKTRKEAVELAMKIYELENFKDCCVMVESPKVAIAVVGGEEKVTKEKLIEIEEKKFWK